MSEGQPGRIGEYEVAGELGRGGQAVVYRARHTRLNRDVALKVLLAARASPTTLQRFEVEGRVLARLRHPNIVPVFDAGREGLDPYIALELVQGESLAEQLERGPLDPSRAIVIAERLAWGVAHAHAEGILHRDIKPANVLIREDGEPLLTDFGIARDEAEVARLTLSGDLLGTPAYMSPEQASGDPVDTRTDVYALGATLYHMLTGRPPFTGATAINVLNAILSRAPEPPRSLRPDISAQLGAICLRCLEKDPAARFASAEELARALGSQQAPAPAPRAPWAVPGVVLVACLGALALQRFAGPEAAAPERTAAPEPEDPPSAAGANALLRAALAEEVPLRRAQRLRPLLARHPHLPGVRKAWTQLQPWRPAVRSEPWPTSRYAPQMCFDAKRRVVWLVGGWRDHAPAGFFPETWSWNGRAWRQHAAGRTPERSAGKLIYDVRRGVCVLVGGCTGLYYANTTSTVWEWDGRAWFEKKGGPGARHSLGGAYDTHRERVVIFGGFNRKAGDLGDTWTYDGARWERIEEGPPRRRELMLAFDAGRGVCVLFGGIQGLNNTQTSLADTWEWDGSRWKECFPLANPGARWGGSMAYDPVRKAVVLVGGKRGGAHLSDVWEWDGSKWTERRPVLGPAGRTRARLIWSPAAGCLELFGGVAGYATFSDLWRLGGEAPLPLSPARWLLLGPLPTAGGKPIELADYTFFPDRGEGDLTPRKGQREHTVVGTATWETRPAPQGVVKLSSRRNSVSYAVATLTLPRRTRAALVFDTADAGRVWINGQRVLTVLGQRARAASGVPVRLEHENRIVVKTANVNGGDTFRFALQPLSQ